jgi:hypothetical protein
MRSNASDVIARLRAADPARHEAPDEIERARVWQLIAAAPDTSSTARPCARKRLQRLTLATPMLAIVAASVLAASGAVRIGADAAPNKQPSAPAGASLMKGAVQLLPLTAPDPGGGPPWGTRLLSSDVTLR